MRFNIPGLVVAAFVLAACSSTGDDSANSGSTGASSASSGGNQTATAPTGPKPGTQQDLEVNIGDRVFFAFDKSNLTADSRTVVERWAAWLKTYPANKVVIQGNTDERGTREYNLALGERRADSARDYLVSLGVDSNRVKIVSFGKERPAVPGSNESAWAQNRRAVVVINAN
ncbi:MAG: peptidoglycan-associated lipoprotein Pal [Rhodospirillaceae bacterium]|jgi:peptidoglycan-associated lipoprotein|nr:peptidoglycan-associated lipoprotein Pal [Rhodospirillaceae bacterium]MBT6405935.1 peptidoglycan-associated lipoprotein Pal [Rhodospirillaceae bacterium]MBT6535873.1 peptidoglycan-associated lipoprotein Pal [Rhodospirillaceae bacterium]MBT7362739.1 peptidoglycan-associated lipoprotein Pal [Rhodospirillaceae bacterium]